MRRLVLAAATESSDNPGCVALGFGDTKTPYGKKTCGLDTLLRIVRSYGTIEFFHTTQAGSTMSCDAGASKHVVSFQRVILPLIALVSIVR
jgi:hypothetical protein